MINSKKTNELPSVVTYEDVKAVSPALEHYITQEARCWTVFGSVRDYHHAIAALLPWRR